MASSDLFTEGRIVSYKHVPSPFINSFLPSPDLTVTELLAFPFPSLPEISTLGIALSSDPPAFPSLDPSVIRAFFAPDRRQLAVLASLILLPDTKSILINDVAFPIDLHYLSCAWYGALQKRDLWKRSIEWITAATKSERSSLPLFAETMELLDQLAWNKPVLNFANGGGSTASLTRHLSDDWMSSDGLAILSELLDAELRAKGLRSRCVSPYWFNTILERHKLFLGKRSGAEKELGRAYQAMRADLSEGRVHQLGGVANIADSHWISFVVCGVNRTIYMGDSMLPPTKLAGFNGMSPRGKITAALQWWLTKKGQFEPYSVELLSVAQQNDTFSCGIYAQNSLEYFFLPEVHARLSVMSTKGARAANFNSIVKHHLDYVRRSF